MKGCYTGFVLRHKGPAMIELIKTGKSWKEWQVCFKGNTHILGEGHAVAVDTNLYNFPTSSDYPVLIEDIDKLSFTDIPQELFLCIENVNDTLGSNIQRLWLDCRFYQVKLAYSWGIKIESWIEPFNPVLLRNEIYKFLLEHSKTNTNFLVHDIDSMDSEYLDLYFEVTEVLDSNIGTVLKNLKKLLDDANGLAKTRLINSPFSDSLVAKFAFNPVVHNSCTRYLHFFIEFLKDMGISADSTVNKKGCDVLFSITPTDKEASLAKIKEALALYLNLPEFDLGNYDIQHLDPVTELKIEKISAEISRLKADIKLNQALLKFEEKAFPSLKADRSEIAKCPPPNFTPLSGFESISINNKKESKEEFLGGFIKLGVYKKAGIEFDWAKLVKNLKNRCKASG